MVTASRRPLVTAALAARAAVRTAMSNAANHVIGSAETKPQSPIASRSIRRSEIAQSASEANTVSISQPLNQTTRGDRSRTVGNWRRASV